MLNFRKMIVLCLLLGSAYLRSQDLKPVARQIAAYHDQEMQFESFDLFEAPKTGANVARYQKAATAITLFQLNKKELKRLLHQKPDLIEIAFPFGEKEKVVVELYRHSILTADFKVTSSDGKTIPYVSGAYYKGIIKGDNKSIAAFSFFQDDIIAVASSPRQGNIVLGKAKDAATFLSYSESALKLKNPFVCGTDGLAENQDQKIAFDPLAPVAEAAAAGKCVRIYYEAGYSAFRDNGSNPYATANWLTGVHNNIATLYSNDGVQIALNEINVWTTPDPYSGSPGDNLSSFRINRPVFNGDLAHLVNTPSSNSVAYVNSLCTTAKHAYSGVSLDYSNVPLYSWTIAAMAHEMGHSFGSPHTHACAWNGNSTAIDGCGPQAGYSEGCNGPIPASGTIMSYCHLVGAGINLSNGFGPQPAALMRNTINARACIGTNCTSACASGFTPNTARSSGNINDCNTWGNPASIFRNTSDTKTIHSGITVTANENWSSGAILLLGNGALSFSGANAIDFTVDQGADRNCGCP